MAPDREERIRPVAAALALVALGAVLNWRMQRIVLGVSRQIGPGGWDQLRTGGLVAFLG